ncbi:vWA domain-containing protein [Desulforhopalus sp. 52FAK]
MNSFTHSRILSVVLTTSFLVQGCSPQIPTTEPEDKVKHATIGKQQTDFDSAKAGNTIPQISTLSDVALVSEQVAQKGRHKELHKRSLNYAATSAAPPSPSHFLPTPQHYSQESYNPVSEQSFIAASNDSLSTFSIDVDTGSYANIRRFLQNGQKVPVGAVRIEEMLNYFEYDYQRPEKDPVAISTELGPCPWNQDHQIAMIGLKAAEISAEALPPSNLVFLIDVSGSMNQPQKLPLVKKSMKMLTKQLSARDRLAIVVYAGSNRVVLPPTSGDQKDTITQAIDQLHSGGSTHGSAAITKAYDLAHQNYFAGANNRIILASDGDFNVGVTDRSELTRLIENEREKGVFLTVLGFGNGNYKDDTMEMLADKGNGNYSYIDSLLEAKKVLVKERLSTLYTLAKDVKLQIEFNPALVGAYRLIGYDNRILADEDFADDTKDAGEIGVGHTVTALYEIIPPDSSDIPEVPQLKYKQNIRNKNTIGDEILTVSLRYKDPVKTESKLLKHTLKQSKNKLKETSNDYRFATVVAWFGMHLQNSEYLKAVHYTELIDIAKNSKGNDSEGLRAEFIKLVETAELLNNS